MKVRVIGLERSEGVSKKTGKPYAMGALFAAVLLDTSRNSETVLSKGAMGCKYEVLPELVRKIEHLPLPFEGDLVVEDVMRFGEKVSRVIDLKPLNVAPNAGQAAPLRAAA